MSLELVIHIVLLLAYGMFHNDFVIICFYVIHLIVIFPKLDIIGMTKKQKTIESFLKGRKQEKRYDKIYNIFRLFE